MASKIDDIKPAGYVFKALSGSMNGIEFSLGSHAYFMCVNNITEGQEDLAQNSEYTERTLHLPTPTPGHNFVVNLEESVTDEEFVVVVNRPDHQETLTFKFNTICHIEGVYFALKREGDAWSQEILQGVLPTVIKTEVQNTSSPKIVTNSSRNKYSWLVTACLLALLGVGGTVAWSKYSVEPVSDSAAHLFQQLVGNNVDYSVQQGRNNIYYVFAHNNQQANWARRSVARADSDETWEVKTYQEEEARLARVLERNHITFFTIRLNDLHTPTVIMSSTRNATDPAALEHVKKTLLDAMPYAKKVKIELKSDQDLVRIAEEGLAALGFNYQITQSDSGVTLSSSMPAEDSRMVEFNRFTSQFYRLWGRHYVHFAAELREDALKEKSFKYGQDGYVKEGKSHWVFNS